MRQIFAVPCFPRGRFRAVTFILLIGVLVANSAYAQEQDRDQAQDASPATANTASSVTIVPQQVRFSGKLAERAGETVEAVFRIYGAAEGGEPLWTETQNVTIGQDGAYTVLLGAASAAGLPQTVFSAGAARWLAVAVDRGPESERVALASVPYAMKAADAAALGGRPAADFVTQQQLAGLAARTAPEPVVEASGTTPNSGPTTTGQGTVGPVTGLGTAGTVPLWTGSNTQGNSEIVQVGSNVGINQAAPAATLDVAGTVNVAGVLSLPPLAAATASAGQRSQLVQLSSSEFSSSTKAPVTSTFKILTNFASNNSASPGGQLEFHYQKSATASSVNVFTMRGDGTLVFAPGQTFPGAITSVTATSPVTAVTTSGAVTVGLDTTAFNATYAQLATPNTFTQTQTFAQGATVMGEVSANLINSTTGYQLGLNAFDTGNFANENSSLGFSLSPAQTGVSNVGVGENALAADTSGSDNTAVGVSALTTLNQGQSNTAVGFDALFSTSLGGQNTAVGQNALYYNASGNLNTAIGYNAGETSNGSESGGASNTFIGANAGPGTNQNLIEATAIGSKAVVNESYVIALGGTAGDAITVGIGTAAPFDDYALDVDATSFAPINGGIVVNGGGGNIYLGLTKGVHKYRVDTNGQVYGAGFNTSGADFAESVAVRGKRSSYEPGDLMVIDSTGDRRLALAKKPYSTLVAGIYSTQPGMLASPYPVDDPRPVTSEVPLAVVGIVPCKVTAENGPIQVGDLLVTSSLPGRAMKGTNRRQMLGAVVGKALEPLAKGTGVIQVLVTLQ